MTIFMFISKNRERHIKTKNSSHHVKVLPKQYEEKDLEPDQKQDKAVLVCKNYVPCIAINKLNSFQFVIISILRRLQSNIKRHLNTADIPK